MLDARELEINFELNYKFMNRTAKEMQAVLQQALNLTNIRQLPIQHNNTRWVCTVDPAAFLRNLPAARLQSSHGAGYAKQWQWLVLA